MSTFFELDGDGWAQRVADAQMRPDALELAEPGFFEGSLGEIPRGVMRGGAKAGLGVGLLLAPFSSAPAPSYLTGSGSFQTVAESPELVDPIFRAVDETAGNAIDYWTPNAKTVGTLGKVLGGVSEMALPLMAGGGNPQLLVAGGTASSGKELIDQGVDIGTAGAIAAAEGAVTYAGFKLPFLGKSLALKMATGAVGNLALGAGATELERQILESRGYQELAQNYDPLDPTARTVDFLTGLAFGGMAHLGSRMTPTQRDATLGANNAKHWQADTAPGIPETDAAAAAHNRAMETAFEQMSRDEPVAVETPADGFKPRPARTLEVPEDLREFEANRQLEVAREAPPPVRPPPQGDAAIRNPVDFEATPEVKLEQLKKLTEENVPVVKKLVDDLNARLKDTESKLNIKEDAKILEKAARPSILARKPWHGVEHIRDSLRFKTVLDRIDQLPDVVGVLKDHGIQVVKVDTAKLMKPLDWGWRIVALDLRMPNGQLFEHYMPLRELEAAKKSEGHQLFEKWRNQDPMKMTAEQRAEMKADQAKSVKLYQDAWDAAAVRAGLDEAAARASLKSFETSASSLMDAQSSARSPMVQPVGKDQAPLTRTPNKLSPETATSSESSAFQPRGDLSTDSSGAILPEGDLESPVITAVKDLLAQQDVKVPTGEVDAEGNAVVRSGREVMAEQEAAIAKAENDAKGFAAAVTCFLTRGIEDAA